jgi:hypothetical protein
LAGGNGRAFHAVEVRLVFLVKLHCGTVSVEVITALNQNGALIRARLTFVEFVTRTGWSYRCGHRNCLRIITLDRG